MSADPAKKLQTLIRKLPDIVEPSGPALVSTHTTDAIVAELVRSFFVWESGCRRGEQALAEVHASMVDYNELRVCLPHEFHRVIPSHDQHAGARFLRLRSALNDIYRREHEISLGHLATLAKRDARAYLDSLEGMHPFISARVCLLSLGAHAFPADARLCSLLSRERALPAELDPAAQSAHGDAGSWLEHHILADDSRSVYQRIEIWADLEIPETAPAGKGTLPKAAKTRAKARPPAGSPSVAKPGSDTATRPARKRSPA